MPLPPSRLRPPCGPSLIFLFLFASSSASLRSLDIPQGLNKMLLASNELDLYCRIISSRLVFNWIPTRGGGGSCAWQFICFAYSLEARSALKRVVRKYYATGSSYCIGCPYSLVNSADRAMRGQPIRRIPVDACASLCFSFLLNWVHSLKVFLGRFMLNSG